MSKRNNATKRRLPGDPTPAQIERFCLKLQSKWTEQERWRRAAHAVGMGCSKPRPYTIPAVSDAEIRQALMVA